MAPPGTKAIIYKDSDTRASWAPHGLDAWLLGPSKDHYHCHLYYVPKMQGYKVSGSANLFPQHCMAPTYTPELHVQELSSKLQHNLFALSRKQRNMMVIKSLARHLDAYITGTLIPPQEQMAEERVEAVEQQRVMDIIPITTNPAIQRVSNTPVIPTTNNPTATRILQTKMRTHQCHTCNNMPGVLPKITRSHLMPPILAPAPLVPTAKQIQVIKKRAQQNTLTTNDKTPRRSTHLQIIPPMSLPRLCINRIISQEAINNLIMDNLINDTTSFTPMKLCPPPLPPVNYEHHAMPMIHPTTGELISSYKRLMNNPDTAEVWMTAFRKDFGGMSQGDNKTGQKGNDVMFVMSLQDIPNIPKDRVVTYARVVVDHHPQKTDPNRIRITAGGNLINYPGMLMTQTADITTSNFRWNSVLSTPGAKYMCLDIKNFYLLAPLDRYEYMCIPFTLFPPWIVEQYGLANKIHNGHIYLEM
jgi:hypothetical protein